MSSTTSRHPDRSGVGPEHRYWLALSRAPGLGTRAWRRLSACSGFPEAVFRESRGALEAMGLPDGLVSFLRSPDWDSVERDLGWLSAAADRFCLVHEDDRYPPLLREIQSAPPILFVRGDVGTLCANQVAIVGSRNPSPAGMRTARELAEALIVAGFTITSGLAIGIDASAHEGALRAGGRTVAVVGTGLDQVYPRRHAALYEAITNSGAVVSEFALGTPAKPVNFPRRNRIISGLGLGTVVVEAGLKSGSLITAKCAADQGREVFAVPGSIHSAVARGCHALIKQGAKLVEGVDDILEELSGFSARSGDVAQTSVTEGLTDPDAARLLKCVAWGPTSVDTLVSASGMSAEKVTFLLLNLELSGYVASTPSGEYCRIA